MRHYLLVLVLVLAMALPAQAFVIVNQVSGTQYNREQWIVGFEVNLEGTEAKDFPLYFYKDGDPTQPVEWVDTDVVNIYYSCRDCYAVLVSVYDREGRFLEQPILLDKDKPSHYSGPLQIRRRPMAWVTVRIQVVQAPHTVNTGSVEIQIIGHRPRLMDW